MTNGWNNRLELTSLSKIRPKIGLNQPVEIQRLENSVELTGWNHKRLNQRLKELVSLEIVMTGLPQALFLQRFFSFSLFFLFLFFLLFSFFPFSFFSCCFFRCFFSVSCSSVYFSREKKLWSLGKLQWKNMCNCW